jgi:hypothetical protein
MLGFDRMFFCTIKNPILKKRTFQKDLFKKYFKNPKKIQSHKIEKNRYDPDAPEI